MNDVLPLNLSHMLANIKKHKCTGIIQIFAVKLSVEALVLYFDFTFFDALLCSSDLWPWLTDTSNTSIKSETINDKLSSRLAEMSEDLANVLWYDTLAPKILKQIIGLIK